MLRVQETLQTMAHGGKKGEVKECAPEAHQAPTRATI